LLNLLVPKPAPWAQRLRRLLCHSAPPLPEVQYRRTSSLQRWVRRTLTHILCATVLLRHGSIVRFAAVRQWAKARFNA
jgi:hypothetical protein